MLFVLRRGSVVVDLLLIVTPIVGFCNCYMFCCALCVFLVSRDCCVALPRDTTGLSAVCDCGIS